jgi:hypothetical protein
MVPFPHPTPRPKIQYLIFDYLYMPAETTYILSSYKEVCGPSAKACSRTKLQE